MKIRISIKQVLRTPWKTGLFFILLTVSISLFTAGTCLLIKISGSMDQAESVFTTLGIIEQEVDHKETELYWDSSLEEYTEWEVDVYDETLGLETLVNLPVDYLYTPVQRPAYGSVSSDFTAFGEENRTPEVNSCATIAVIRPLEDCRLSEPTEVFVEKIFWGELKDLDGQITYLCEHTNPHPQLLEKGKTYISMFYTNYGASRIHEGFSEGRELNPVIVFEDQEFAFVEITDGFFDTAEGKRWITLADEMEKWAEGGVPVTPVDNTLLLLPFHEGDAVVSDGEDISVEEYEKGDAVCLISKRFSDLNGLQVGDTIELPLYFAEYQLPGCKLTWTFYGGFYIVTPDVTPGLRSSFLVNEEGKTLEPFQTKEYRVKGIYTYTLNDAQTVSGYGLGANEIIIPKASVTENYEDHILQDGPIKGYNTSFAIPNGTTEEFLEAFYQIPESEKFQITFYDNGYSQFEKGIRQIRTVAVILFIAGLAASLGVIAFILYFMVVQQKRQIMIEKALGLSFRECLTSMLVGILLLAGISGICGTTLGVKLNESVQKEILNDQEVFSTEYTKGAQGQTEEVPIASDVHGEILILWITLGEMLVVGAGAATLVMKILKETPMAYLGRKE